MGTDAAACGENAVGCDHAAQILRGCLEADEQHFLALGLGRLGAVGVEVHFAGGGTRACREAFGDGFGLLHRRLVKDRGEQLIQVVRRDAFHGVFPGDQFFFHHLAGDAYSGQAGAFAVAGLEHEHFFLLDGELEVLHVAEMFLKHLADAEQFLVRAGQNFLKVGNGVRCADAGHHVFALGVHHELAPENVFAGGGVAGEGDAGAGVIAGVAEHHRLHVDRRAPLDRDVVLAAVNDGAVVHPRTKHSTD